MIRLHLKKAKALNYSFKHRNSNKKPEVYNNERKS